ncbi:uncharacterized protein LOC127095307 [Lathyrus oleraceus]|uniref:uncharacterized protein LOC127095307 n=1 Tax=Pisum sativum TaxID=3888 RepID=UPI0021D23780|nr:uncharacterized protein LOC127095307 [Pisum sativum]
MSKIRLQAIRDNGWDSLLNDVSLFCEHNVVDRQLQELNNRFTEVNTELLLCVACLSPSDSFSAFDNESEFSELEEIGDLSIKLVETKKHVVYPFVYLLLKLSLILPVATATTERVFSAMNIIKNQIRNRMSDDWLNDCLVTYIERDIFVDVENEKIIQHFSEHEKS